MAYLIIEQQAFRSTCVV